jgi:hypothetical protein
VDESLLFGSALMKSTFTNLLLLMMLVSLLVSCRDQASLAAPSTLKSTTNGDGTGVLRTGFVPLDNPLFLSAADSSSFPEDEMVLAMEWKGESRAYPMRMLWFHHIVNDTIAERPFLITF